MTQEQYDELLNELRQTRELQEDIYELLTDLRKDFEIAAGDADDYDFGNTN